MPIKSFRGKLGSDVQEKISLATNDGSIGYRIVKFQIFPGNFNVTCLLYTSPSPRDGLLSRMPSSA